MKTRNAAWLFLAGAIAGLSLALCLGAAEKKTEKPEAAKPEPPKADWSHLKVVTYPSGTTGFFDPDTGKLYLYDVDLVQCFMVRELTALGAPLRRIRD